MKLLKSMRCIEAENVSKKQELRLMKRQSRAEYYHADKGIETDVNYS
jgi:hypothetical protein